MDLNQSIDIYCERLGPEFWAEPINAVTNAAFILAALILWPRTRGIPIARVLVVILACIGVGSYLFHTHAQVWAAIADVTPILGYILVYIYAVNRHVWGLRVLPKRGERIEARVDADAITLGDAGWRYRLGP